MIDEPSTRPRDTPESGVRAVFAGSVARDTIALVETYPAADERVRASRIVHAVGGPAATAAVACARQGISVALVGATGDDAAGAAIRRTLIAEGVDISGLARVPEAASSQSVIVVDRRRGTRAISNLVAPPPTAIDCRAWAETAAWLHVDARGWSWLAPARAALPRAVVSVDEGNEKRAHALAGIDLYVPTLAVLRQRFGGVPIRELLTAAIRAGAREVIATDGENGAFGVDADGAFYRCEAFTEHEIVSTLGAGDVFHGALVAARIGGRRAVDALAYASMAAALSCRALDGQSAIPGRAEIEAGLADAGRR